jgi:hypothetical protein
MVVLIITLNLNLSTHYLLSCPNSLCTKPCSSNLLLLVVCFIRLLQKCCNYLPFLHLNLNLLLGLFLKICCLTQVHTYISKWVSLHSFFEIAMKFISCFFTIVNDQVTMKVAHYCLISSLSTTCSVTIIVVVAFLACLTSPSFLFL